MAEEHEQYRKLRFIVLTMILLQMAASVAVHALSLFDIPFLLAVAAFISETVQPLSAAVLIVALTYCWWARCNFQAAAAVRRQARASPRGRSRSTQPGLQLP